MLADRVARPGPLSQPNHRDQPRARHEVLIIETPAVVDAHWADVVLLGPLEPVKSPIIAVQKDIRAAQPAPTTKPIGGSRLSQRGGLTHACARPTFSA